jgi:tetratricopeptide (TPR) repeat protein
MEAVWPGIAVEPNNIVQAVKGLRKALGERATFIQNVPRQGYELAIDVEHRRAKSSHLAAEALLAPHRAFVEGRALFETFDLRAIARARDVFEAGVVADPDYVDALIGLANVLALQFEATRDDVAPAFDVLERGVGYARAACARETENAEALATHGFVLFLSGDPVGAIAMLNEALRLEPESGLLALRLGYVAWGRGRRRAAARVLRECPGLALGIWQAVTVLIALRAFDRALALLREGCAAQDQQPSNSRFNAVGLHLLCALVLGALGRLEEAIEELARELALADDDHVYGRECRANTWYTLGALLLRLGRRDDAIAAFRQALAVMPNHRFAAIGLTYSMGTLSDADAAGDVTSVDAAIAKAIVLTLLDRHPEAAAVITHALKQAPAGQAGWQLPVEPLLNVPAPSKAWANALALLRHRAL